MKEYVIDTENQNTDEENEETYLNLDLSILTDRNSSERKTSIADWNGIRIFDIATEERIREHQGREKEEVNRYKEVVFNSNLNPNEKELEYIKNNVFATIVIGGKNLNPKKKSEPAWISNVIIVSGFLIVLLVGIWYGRYKGKVRVRKLADIDNSYEE